MASFKSYIQEAAASLGYPALKPEQGEAITQFLMGRDVFVALPTGYGKSLCYCCLPRVFDLVRSVEEQSIVMVVSPLTALMKDQVAACHSKGLTAGYVIAEAGHKSMKQGVLEGKYQLVFLSTESLFCRHW